MNSHLKLYNSIISKFGQDWHEITDIETFSVLSPDLSQAQTDLLGAFKAISSTIIPWNDCYVFENIVDAINGNPVDVEDETQPDIDDIMYAMYIMEGIRPGIPYSTEIAKYIAARAMVEGLLYVPQPANIANEFLRIPDTLLPIAKKISEMSADGILGYPLEPRRDDDVFIVQIDKLQNVLLAYKSKVTQAQI